VYIWNIISAICFELIQQYLLGIKCAVVIIRVCNYIVGGGLWSDKNNCDIGDFNIELQKYSER